MESLDELDDFIKAYDYMPPETINQVALRKLVFEFFQQSETKVVSPIEVLDKLNAGAVTSKSSAWIVFNTINHGNAHYQLETSQQAILERVFEVVFRDRNRRYSDEVIKYKTLLNIENHYLDGKDVYGKLTSRAKEELKYLAGLIKPSLFPYPDEQIEIFDLVLKNIALSDEHKRLWQYLAKKIVEKKYNLFQFINSLYTTSVTNLSTYNLLRYIWRNKITKDEWRELAQRDNVAPLIIRSMGWFDVWFDVNTDWFKDEGILVDVDSNKKFSLNNQGAETYVWLGSSKDQAAELREWENWQKSEAIEQKPSVVETLDKQMTESLVHQLLPHDNADADTEPIFHPEETLKSYVSMSQSEDSLGLSYKLRVLSQNLRSLSDEELKSLGCLLSNREKELIANSSTFQAQDFSELKKDLEFKTNELVQAVPHIECRKQLALVDSAVRSFLVNAARSIGLESKRGGKVKLDVQNPENNIPAFKHIEPIDEAKKFDKASKCLIGYLKQEKAIDEKTSNEVKEIIKTVEKLFNSVQTQWRKELKIEGKALVTVYLTGNSAGIGYWDSEKKNMHHESFQSQRGRPPKQP